MEKFVSDINKEILLIEQKIKSNQNLGEHDFSVLMIAALMEEANNGDTTGQ